MTIQKLLNYWLGKKREGFFLFWGFVSAAAYFGGTMVWASKSPGLSAALTWTGLFGFLVDAAAFFIHMNLHSCHWFLEHFQDTDHLPRKQIGLVNSFCMTLFLGICLVALPGAAWGLEPVWQALRRWFAGRAALDQAVYPALHMEPEREPGPDLAVLLGEAKPTPQWILMLDEALRVLGYVMLAVLVFLLIRSLCRGVWRWITKPRQFDSDEKIYLTPSWPLVRGRKRLVPKEFSLSPRSYNHRIRRLYQKEVLALARKNKAALSPSSSPRELEKAVGMERKGLHQMYEKARYGKEECGRDEWDKAKEQ